MRRIDLKANSHVFLLWVRAFPTLHWKECKEQMFPSACKHRTLLRSKEKSQSIGERQKSAVCAPAVPRACSFCANGFSRPRYVFWLWRERQTLECSDMRTGGVCCPPTKLLRGAGGCCFFCESQLLNQQEAGGFVSQADTWGAA